MSARREELTSRAVSVRFGSECDVLAKKGGEVALVGTPDLRPDLDERHVSLSQQPLGLLHPARDHVLVGR